MIDVFSLLIIFLVAGSVFGASSLLLPSDVKLPKSFRSETILAAPQVTIHKNETVSLSFARSQYPVDAFRPKGGARDPRLEALKTEITAYLQNDTSNTRPGALLNLVADRAASYATVYDVLQYFRKNGFESVLFVSESEEGAQ